MAARCALRASPQKLRSLTALLDLQIGASPQLVSPSPNWSALIELGPGHYCRNFSTRDFDVKSRYSVHGRHMQDQVGSKVRSKAVIPSKVQKDDQEIDQNKSDIVAVSNQRFGSNISAVDKRKFLINTTVKWMLSKGQGTTVGTYAQLIRALEKDNRAEEAHRLWEKKIGHDLHSVPWRVCDLMISIYYRNNMLERLVKLFKGLESYDRVPPSKSIVQKVADAYEMLGSLEEKNRIMAKYSDLFSKSSERLKKSRKASRKNGKITGTKKDKNLEALDEGPAVSGPFQEFEVPQPILTG